ncbi:hypothetical protein D3C81_1726270 [compost metagenome]
MGTRRAAEPGQTQAVGLPQTDALIEVAGGDPLFHLVAAGRVLFDPGQAQVEQRIAVGRIVGQRLYGFLVAPLSGQRLHQQRPRFIVVRHFSQQVTHQLFDFAPVAFFRLTVAAVHVGITAKLLELGQRCGVHSSGRTQAQQQAAQ